MTVGPHGSLLDRRLTTPRSSCASSSKSSDDVQLRQPCNIGSDEAVIAKVAAALGSAQLPVQEVRRADAAIERMRSAASERARSFAAT